MHIPLILFLLYIIYFVEAINKNLIINVVNDLVKDNKKSSSIISLFCFSQHKNIYISATFMEKGYKYANINNFGNKTYYLNNEHNSIFLADVQCSGFSRNIAMANKNRLFDHPFRWIIFGGEKKGNASIVPQELINSNILIDSEVLVILSSGNEIFLLYSIFKARANTFWRTEFFGTWTKVGLEKSQEANTSTALRRIGLSELNIRVNYVLLHNETRGYLDNFKNNHIDSITRVGYWSTNALIDFMRCNRTYLYTDEWGYFINNSWTGLTRSLSKDECDLGGSPMFKLKKRLEYLKFLTSPVRTKMMFLFRQPPLSYEHNLYWLAFTNLVWVSILCLIFILILALFVSAYWEYKRKNMAMGSSGLILGADVSDITTLTLGALCQQGSPVELKSSIGRVVMLALFIISTFLYTSYSANIVVLRQSTASNIRTLKDLLNSKLDLGVEDMNYIKYYFSTATDPIRKAIYETKVAPPGRKRQFYTMDEGVMKIKNEYFAFHMELGTGYKFVERYFYEGEKCGLTEIAYLDVQDPLLTCQKHSPYYEIFKIGLCRIEEFGINSRSVNLLYTKKPKCLSRGGNFVSVSFRDSYPALLIFGYGVLSAFIILLIENLLYRIRKQNN